jgi:hypothetical protein
MCEDDVVVQGIGIALKAWEERRLDVCVHSVPSLMAIGVWCSRAGAQAGRCAAVTRPDPIEPAGLPGTFRAAAHADAVARVCHAYARCVSAGCVHLIRVRLGFHDGPRAAPIVPFLAALRHIPSQQSQHPPD